MAFEFLAQVIGHSGGESFELRLNFDLVVRGNYSFGTALEGAELESQQVGMKRKAAQTKKLARKTCPRATEAMIAVQSGTLLRALRLLLKRRVSACRGGDYYEVFESIQKESRPCPSPGFV